MQVHILFFGVLKDLAGQTRESIVVPEGATLGDVLNHYEARIPELKRLLPSLAVSVNQQYAGPEVKLNANDEIGFLPPVSGGSEGSAWQHVAILKDKIDPSSILQQLKRSEDGAAVVFEGVVRDNTRGRRTLYLDYEAYEPMAVKQMEELALEALREFKIRDVRIVHRLGRLAIGETSVLIVVASAHRAAAFEACRWLIDTLKRTVPIWKKEYFEDGAVWADGESFPAELPRAEGTGAAKPASN
jgi:MoaE-MoaD fusion protein